MFEERITDPAYICDSWHRSAIVWKGLEPAFRITTHSQAVWDVKCVGTDRYLTASADKVIQLHSDDGKLLQTYTGHTDCVRSLALTVDGMGFWSAGNDGSVRTCGRNSWWSNVL
jgi:phospholipase A-2-activating protein